MTLRETKFPSNLTTDRLVKITSRMDNKGFYKKATLQHLWVKQLEKNCLHFNYEKDETTTLFEWASPEQICEFHSIFAPLPVD
jgi:hypothetical protein